MSSVYVSTSYLYSSLSRPTMSLQSALVDAQTEAVTGKHANLAQFLGSQADLEISLRNQAADLEAYVGTNAVVSARLNATQSAFDTIRSSAQQFISGIAGSSSFTSLSKLGDTALASLTSAMNLNAAGEYVFGGINTQTPPLKQYDGAPTSSAKAAVDAAFQASFGFSSSSPQVANISAAQMQSFLDGPFQALFQGSNWTSNWSNASSENATIRISPEASATTTANANSTGFQSLASAYVMMAEFGKAPFSSAVQTVVGQTATGAASRGMASLVNDEAALGSLQSSVDQATQSISAQSNLISQQLGALDNVDVNKVSVTISTLTTQLQTAYSLTAKLKALNLSQYVPS